MPVRRIELLEYVVLLGKQIRRLDCETQYDVLIRRFDTSYPTSGYGVSDSENWSIRRIGTQYGVSGLVGVGSTNKIFQNFLEQLDAAYGSKLIRRIGNWSNALSCEVLAPIHCFDSNEEEVVPKVDDVSLVDGVFDGAFGEDGEEYFVMGEGVVVSSSSLYMFTKICLGGMMVSLIFLEGLEEEA
ncbi:hypothetical protein Tco_0864924 [Tanacetum coccineum]